MTELWLKFKDERGDDRRILVEGSKFVIGRHSENDLCIPNNKLSRQHVKIESFGDFFVVSDCGSSNGTTLNGAELRDPVALKDGDVLNLGGGLEIETEMISDKPKAGKRSAADDDDEDDYSGGAGGQSSSVSGGGSSSIPTAVFIAAPVLAIIFLMCGGGFLYLYDGGNNNDRNDIAERYPTPYQTPDEPQESPSPKTSPTTGNSPNSTTISPSPEQTSSETTPPVSDEKKKIENNSAAFLRRIAVNDPTAFLRTAEIEMVNARLTPFKGSSNLAENLKAVKNDASQFESLAQSKGLKAQFLATAALTKLGNNRGNPLETAKQMLPFLGDLRVSLGNTLADDNLLIMADYPRRSANQRGSLQGILEAIPKSSKLEKADPREIRTIWYLKRNNKISDEGFELALRFLAIGTITQNPKDFNVNTEAVIFN